MCKKFYPPVEVVEQVAFVLREAASSENPKEFLKNSLPEDWKGYVLQHISAHYDGGLYPSTPKWVPVISLKNGEIEVSGYWIFPEDQCQQCGEELEGEECSYCGYR